jgi:hypothetical protein
MRDLWVGSLWVWLLCSWGKYVGDDAFRLCATWLTALSDSTQCAMRHKIHHVWAMSTGSFIQDVSELEDAYSPLHAKDWTL